jgi:hypothetical protein
MSLPVPDAPGTASDAVESAPGQVTVTLPYHLIQVLTSESPVLVLPVY